MKILIDLTSLDDNLSGIERYAACISLEMIKQFDEEYILLFKNKVHPYFLNIAEKENVKSIIIPGCNKLIFNQLRLPRVINRIDADWYLFLAFPVPVFLFKKNMVSTIHDLCCWDCPETMKGMMKWYYRLSHSVALKKCHSIITISEFSKKRIHDRLNYPEEKIWLIYCGIDQDQFVVHKEKFASVREKYHLPEKYILSLSTLEPRKNIPLLIHAYEELIEENYPIPPLVLAGRKGWKMEELLSSIDDKVREKIVFTGFVDDEDLPEVYAMAYFFVFPSIYEGFGIPPLEALACGTPVISSDAASLPEVLEDAALYFRNNELEMLKNILIRIGDVTNDMYKDLIYEGIDKVNKFDWARESSILYRLLSEKSNRDTEL